MSSAVPFGGSVSALPLSVYAAAVAVAVFLSAIVERREGRWSFLEEGRLVGARVVFHVGPGRAVLLQAANRLGLVLRLVLPVLLIGGVATRWAGALLALSLLVAHRVAPKHTLVFLGLCCVVLTVPAHVPDLVSATTASQPEADALPGAVLLSSLYLNGAVSKLRSPQFRSGAALAVIAAHLTRRAAPSRLRSVLEWSRRNRGVLRRTAITVIAVEAMLPLGLALPATLPAAVTVGVAMHLAFLTIQPSRLLPFQIATIGSYACFWALSG